MCGIVAYVGKKNAEPILFAGLKKIEYRGYDSAGIVSLDKRGHFDLRRAAGKLDRLAKRIERGRMEGTIGIGHTRWATHGPAIEKNAHPHIVGKVAVVHNGIIENFLELRKELEEKGCRFVSDTDTEVIPQLININLERNMDPIAATRAALQRLTGSFAVVVMFEGNENLLIAVRKGSPLSIGFGSGGSLVGSGELALAGFAERIAHLEEGDMAVITRDGATIYDGDDRLVDREIKAVSLEENFTGKAGHSHFMLKEILEQPEVIKRTIEMFIDAKEGGIVIPNISFDFANISRLMIVGCGSASYAGLVGRYWFEGLAKIPADWDSGSEFRYRDMPLLSGHAGIFLSQSGETADTLAALDHIRVEHPTLAVVNVPQSTMSRLAGAVIYTPAYPEISVASTKAFTAQLTVLACLTIGASRVRESIGRDREAELVSALKKLPENIRDVLRLNGIFADIAESLARAKDVFYIGRGTNYAIALEGALKLKEIAYVHAEAYAAGELKHGPLALIDKDVPVIVIAPRDQWFEKTASNVQEIATRGGRVILLSDQEGCDALESFVSKAVVLPEADPFLAPMLYAVAVQLLAYHVATSKGNDIDQPRNLAKSVTVE